MQNNEQERHTGTGMWGLLGLVALPVLCCGLQTLIGVLGVTTAGAVLASDRYWIVGGLVILIGIVMFIVSRRRKKSGTDSCCAISPSDLSSKEKA
ncbi:MerE protein [Alicyclobacillus sacchari]|uniref:MerE protein n=1 Tax=Alicyclobacillus sacchari TaxID=392010 RepID=A0A4R8LLR3_9BACL|nr:hypothetical protein [Alicyclobacillus sacchari]TDY43967.1 MerE protein [Alicyclobacillus sacchari]GMA58194.1 hypothetical protein GCM10025858_26970 [Alicyclobacillus sacchari]